MPCACWSLVLGWDDADVCRWRQGRILRSYRTRGRPRDVVAAGNTVWVATTEPNELVSFSGAATR